MRRAEANSPSTLFSSPRLLRAAVSSLLLVLLPTAVWASAEPPNSKSIKDLAQEYRRAHLQANWPRAIEAGLELVRIAPDNAGYRYNVACAYARNAQPEKAAEWLIDAAKHGFSLLRLFETDADLDGVRSHEAYRTALEIVRANRQEDLVELRLRFEENPLLVVVPPAHDEDQPAPLIVVLHGRGGLAFGVAAEWQNVAAELGAILVAPQAVCPVSGAPGFSWSAEDTLDSLHDNAEFLVQLALDAVMKEYRIDEERIILTGFSEGGFVAQGIGPRAPYKFTGVIPMGTGYVRAYDAPPKATGNRPPRFYFMIGEQDRPVEEARLAAKDFAAAGFPTKIRVYPLVGHTFPIDRDEELRKALRFVLRR